MEPFSIPFAELSSKNYPITSISSFGLPARKILKSFKDFFNVNSFVPWRVKDRGTHSKTKYSKFWIFSPFGII